VKVFDDAYDKAGGQWVDSAIAGVGGEAARTAGINRIVGGNPPTMMQFNTGKQLDELVGNSYLANLDDALRTKYKVKDSVKGVVIVGVDADSAANSQHLSPGDVIVEVAQEAVTSADDFQAKIDKLKRDGRPSALLLVANPAGDLRFIALSLK